MHYTCVNTHVCVFACASACVCWMNAFCTYCTHRYDIYVYSCLGLYMYMFAYLHLLICIYIYTQIYMYTCLSMYICMYACMYVHVCIHIICVYIYLCVSLFTEGRCMLKPSKRNEGLELCCCKPTNQELPRPKNWPASICIYCMYAYMYT